MSRKGKMGMSGKQVLMLGLVALVITAGYYRWTIEADKYESVPVNSDAIPVAGEEEKKQESKATEEQKTENKSETKTESKTLSQLREERDRGRGEIMEEWKKTAQSSEASVDAKKEAEKKMKTATEYSEKEKSIEILIKSKGYSDCFAQISDSGVVVMVSGGELNGSKVAQMKDIIVGETGVEVRNIKISAE